MSLPNRKDSLGWVLEGQPDIRGRQEQIVFEAQERDFFLHGPNLVPTEPGLVSFLRLNPLKM